MGTPERSATAQQMLDYACGKATSPHLKISEFTDLEWAEALLELFKKLQPNLRNYFGFKPLTEVTRKGASQVMPSRDFLEFNGITMQVFTLFDGSVWMYDVSPHCSDRLLLDRNGNLWMLSVYENADLAFPIRLIENPHQLASFLNEVNYSFQGRQKFRTTLQTVIMDSVIKMIEDTIEARQVFINQAEADLRNIQATRKRLYEVAAL